MPQLVCELSGDPQRASRGRTRDDAVKFIEKASHERGVTAESQLRGVVEDAPSINESRDARHARRARRRSIHGGARRKAQASAAP